MRSKGDHVHLTSTDLSKVRVIANSEFNPDAKLVFLQEMIKIASDRIKVSLNHKPRRNN
jgi:hypothetical protein